MTSAPEPTRPSGDPDGVTGPQAPGDPTPPHDADPEGEHLIDVKDLPDDDPHDAD